MAKKKEIRKSFTFKARDNEHEAILKWLNDQDNVTDSLRYLIEREIMQNGIRNLQSNIPSERPFDPKLQDDIYGLSGLASPVQKVISPEVIEMITNITKQNPLIIPTDKQTDVTPVKKKVNRKVFSDTVVNGDIDEDDLSCWE